MCQNWLANCMPDLETAIDHWVEISFDALENMLKAAMPQAQFLPLPVNAVIFGALGKFVDGWHNAMDNNLPYEEKMQSAWAEVMMDPRVDMLVQTSMTNAVDAKVEEMLDGQSDAKP